MIVSLSNAILCPQRQVGGVVATAAPVLGGRLNCNRGIGFLNRGHRFDIGFHNEYSRRRVYPVAKSEGSWEEPDDGSDESEYEDDDEDEDEDEESEEDNDLDYESDWEAKDKNKALVIQVDELSTRKYEEDLAKGL